MSLPWIENLPSSRVIPDIADYVLKLRYRKYEEFSALIKNRFPIPLSIAYSYIRSLSFDQDPDYDYIEKLLRKELENIDLCC